MMVLHFNYAFVTAIGFASVKTVIVILAIIMFAIWAAKLLTLQEYSAQYVFFYCRHCYFILMMNISVVSVVPWQQAKDSEFVVSVFINELQEVVLQKLQPA